MLIESIIQRPKGTHVVLADGAAYTFLPDASGRHVAEVDDDLHIEAFLRIPEGYRLARAVVAPKTVTQVADVAQVKEPLEAIAPADPVTAAVQFGVQPVLHSQAESGDDAPKSEDGDKDEGDKNAADEALPSHDDLVKAYTAKFGRAPHHKMTDANIMKHLKGED
ncbi:hypothetical protein V5F77_04365 [Xanthobacter sp. DSM 24535]|uniref:hypothetical protein n=1 Tax=Roseixanthobacter psychrophilus TaxID=3119917 RepID=UPI003727FFEA